MAKAYRVRDWDHHFERNHKPTEVIFRWIAIPTRHDGKGYQRLARHRRNVEVFCAFNLILQVAAKMPLRGTLVDEDGPLDASDLSDATGYPSKIFDAAFTVLTDKSLKINWLEEFEYASSSDKSEQVPLTGQDSTGQDRTEHTPKAPKGAVAGVEPKPTDSVGFLRFWAAWPKHERKTNRKTCLKRWNAASLEPLTEEILRGLNRWKASAQWAKEKGRFIPAPLVWLNQERWTAADALDPAESGPGDNGFVRAVFTPEAAEKLGHPHPLLDTRMGVAS